jgi:hypothetical protein
MERDFEKGGAVEYDPGRIPAFFVARGGGIVTTRETAVPS